MLYMMLYMMYVVLYTIPTVITGITEFMWESLVCPQVQLQVRAARVAYAMVAGCRRTIFPDSAMQYIHALYHLLAFEEAI